MGSGPNPNLVKSTALSKAQGLFSRINSLLPSYSTPISPVTVYEPLPAALASLPQPTAVVGNALQAAPTGGTTNALWGVWVAPNINNGADYPVQVECFGAGAGGGGGNVSSGGGGAGGGEYACEPVYTVTPGQSYIWLRGVGGAGGSANSNSQSAEAGGGFSAGDTIFDLASVGIPGGVHAHGGQPGDLVATGQGGPGGTGSINTIVSTGGAGATNNSGYASDNPQAFLSNPTGLWTQQPSAIACWLPMDDYGNPVSIINNQQNENDNAVATNYQGSVIAGTNPLAPNQAPTQNNFSGSGLITQSGSCLRFKYNNVGNPAGSVTCPSFPFSGKYLMISGWVQCDPSGIWGSPTIANVTISANCAYPNANVAGMALYFHNFGTSSAPSWQLGLYCGENASNTHSTYAPLASTTAPTPGTWYYVVGVFNNGQMTLYVNNVQVKTETASFTTVGGGAYAQTIGLRPDASTGQFFGYTSNFWYAEGVPTTALLTTAFGSTPPTGGAGGGASGGASTGSAPFTNGGAGVEASGVSFGAGGSPPTQSAAVANITTSGQGGGNGSNSHVNKGGTLTIQGSGGGGCGSSVSVVPTATLTEVVTAAASYNGIDGSNPGALYNPNQQGTGSTLIAGGQASDPVTGSKNAILLLPPGLKAALASPNTIVACYLTVYNSNPTNTITPILEVNYSADSSLPGNYTNSAAYSSITQVTPYVLQSETTAQQINLMNTGFTSALQSGAATALVIGPGGTAATPPNAAMDAYNAPTANYFYTGIYGPGATDAFNNSLAPTLTIVYTSSAPFQGQTGGGGYIAVTSINNEGIPVATVEPYQTTDADGNVLGAGFTGQINAFSPMTANQVPGAFTPEVWHDLSPYLQGTWTFSNPIGFRLTAQGDLQFSGQVIAGSQSPASLTIAQLPAGYYNSAFGSYGLTANLVAVSITTGSFIQRLVYTSSGTLKVGTGPTIGSGNTISLDGTTFALSSASLY